uniref:Serine/arginine repetitive matrix protein 2 n=1 Tax=Loa loa TaxID=7209 RepID=A0A1I7VWA4_LOALO
MNDDLLDNYNPLYDVHLRQYFAMPHMQRHLRNIGLLDDVRLGENVNDRESKQHHTMIDKMLRNREAELQKYADLQRKLHAAEKIEICRRIRSGTAIPNDCHRAKPSRSLSRGGRSLYWRYIRRFRRRRSSASTDDKDLVQRIEAENDEPMYENPSLVYNRLSTNILKYRYLHKLDDETLAVYMEQLRRQLNRLERFRQVSFGPFSVARHQNDPQMSWFFRRRSLPSLTDTTPTTTITNTTTTITSSATQSNIYEQPTLRYSNQPQRLKLRILIHRRSINILFLFRYILENAKSTQSLNQHRSRSSKPQSSRSGVSDNSYDNYSQSKRQYNTENNARLPPVSRKVKSGQAAINDNNVIKTPRGRKSTPIEAKKVAQKTTRTTPTGHRTGQKIKPRISPELTDLQATISATPKLVVKPQMESVKPGNERSPLNFDDERKMYSDVTSPENIDLRTGREAMFEKSVLPLDHSIMPVDDEKRSQSNVSKQMVEEPKIDQSKTKNERNSDLPFDLSPETSKKTELEMIDTVVVSEIPPVSKWTASEAAENLVSCETSFDSLQNETDSQEMILSEEIDEDQSLAGNGMETENKPERLLTSESSTDERETVQIDNQQDRLHQLKETFRRLSTEELKLVEEKMAGEFEKTDEIISSPTAVLVAEDKLSEISNADISVKEPEITPTGDNTFLYTETENRKVSNAIECDVNEFVAINGKILEVSPQGKLEGQDSVVISEIYSVDPKEGIPATEKNLAEVVENRTTVGKSLLSSAVSPGKLISVEEPEGGVCHTEIEYSGGQEFSNHQVGLMKIKSEVNQDPGEHDIERLSKFPKPILVSETSVTKDDSLELPRLEISFEQLQDSMGNEQKISGDEHLSEKTEITSSATGMEELESAKDAFQLGKFPDCFVDKQLKYQEKNVPEENKVTDGSLAIKIQQPDAKNSIDGLESNDKCHTDEKPESFASVFDVSVNDTSSVENSDSKINEEIFQNMELQWKMKEVSEGIEVSEAEARAEIEITNNTNEKVNDVLQTESEEPESSGDVSVTHIYVKRSEHNDTLVDESKTKTVLGTKPATPEIIAAGKERLPEIILLNPENLVIEGLTDNSEPVISGTQESQPFILASLETMKQESDGQANALTSSTLNTITSGADHFSGKEYRSKEKESSDKLNSTKVESEISESTEDSLLSNVLRSGITSVEIDAEATFEEKSPDPIRAIPEYITDDELERKKEVERNEILLEMDCTTPEQLPSEAFARESSEAVIVAGKSKCCEEIPKIVVCNDETTEPDTETIDHFQMEAIAETLDQQEQLLEKTKEIEESEISKGEEVMTSMGNDAPEEVSDGTHSIRRQLNEFLEQYMHDMIQNVAQLAGERIETSKTSEKETEEVAIQKTSESQRIVSVPECISEFPSQFSEINSPKSDSDEDLQKRVENLLSHDNILSSMHPAKANNSDERTETSESRSTAREVITISHPYHTDTTGKFEGGQDNCVLSEHRSNVEHDIPPQQIGNNVGEELTDDTDHFTQAEGCAQEMELEKCKLESEIPQTTAGSSTNSMLSKYYYIINGLTADGQLILSSVNDSMLSSEDKFISYFAPNKDACVSVNEKIPLITDTNGNPEIKVCGMQKVSSEVFNESKNICAADVNANISQETIHVKPIKDEENTLSAKREKPQKMNGWDGKLNDENENSNS